MTLAQERLITTKLLIDDLEMWDEFDIRKNQDPQVSVYYNEIIQLINQQIQTGVDWLDTDDARDYFYGEAEYQQDVFRALEDEWDDILEDCYGSVDELIEEIYNKGKQKGYSDIKQRIRFTETDKQAIRIARNYNYHLIRKIDWDTRHQIKNVITRGVIAGEHPSKIAPKILNVAEEQLEGSIFTPKQRATLIARTETSRVQNTGILQTYINEGYTEIKILTAEDNNVCTTCLKYAYEFNNNAEVTYENRGEEKVHNIIQLIEEGYFPPFHPLCRCTYLSVWKSKGEVPEDPYVVNLTPMKFLDDGAFVLPNGKPNIKWTEESLKRKLKNFVDNKNELNILSEAVMDYMTNIKNRNIEYLNAMDNNFNVVCNQHTLNKSNEVELCNKGKKAAKNDGLLFVIHNHPSNNPLHSQDDLLGFAAYNTKYNFVFTEEQGLFILKNNGADYYDIKMGWNDIFQKMEGHYRLNNPKSYDEELKKYRLGVNSYKKFKRNIKLNVLEYMGKNLSVSIKTYKDILARHNVDVLRTKP